MKQIKPKLKRLFLPFLLISVMLTACDSGPKSDSIAVSLAGAWDNEEAEVSIIFSLSSEYILTTTSTQEYGYYYEDSENDNIPTFHYMGEDVIITFNSSESINLSMYDGEFVLVDEPKFFPADAGEAEDMTEYEEIQEVSVDIIGAYDNDNEAISLEIFENGEYTLYLQDEVVSGQYVFNEDYLDINFMFSDGEYYAYVDDNYGDIIFTDFTGFFYKVDSPYYTNAQEDEQEQEQPEALSQDAEDMLSVLRDSYTWNNIEQGVSIIFDYVDGVVVSTASEKHYGTYSYIEDLGVVQILYNDEERQVSVNGEGVILVSGFEGEFTPELLPLYTPYEPINSDRFMGEWYPDDEENIYSFSIDENGNWTQYELIGDEYTEINSGVISHLVDGMHYSMYDNQGEVVYTIFDFDIGSIVISDETQTIGGFYLE